MPLLETAVAAVGRLALAAGYDRPALAKVGPRATDGRPTTHNESGTTLKLGSGFPQAAVYTVAALAWLSERRTLNSRNLDHDAKAAVRFKDLLVAGSVITGVANLIGEQLLRQKYPDGVHVTEKGGLSAETPDEIEHFRRYFKVMGTLNQVFVAGAVAATPFINFGLFNAYKPHPIRSFFKL